MVSVVIGTYNHGAYIAKAIGSVLEQDFEGEMEIIIGDDNSEDDTYSICQKFAAKDSRIRLFQRNRSEVIYINGRPTGRNNFLKNIAEARGKYIALLDGDDYWDDSSKIRKQVQFLENNKEFALCFHDAQLVDAEENLLQATWLNHTTEVVPRHELMAGFPIPTLSMLFRNVLNLNRESVRTVPSLDLYLVAMLGCHGRAKNLYRDIRPGAYRQTGEGVWTARQTLSKLEAELFSRKCIYSDISLTKKKAKKRALRRMMKPLRHIAEHDYSSFVSSKKWLERELLKGPFIGLFKEWKNIEKEIKKTNE